MKKENYWSSFLLGTITFIYFNFFISKFILWFGLLQDEGFIFEYITATNMLVFLLFNLSFIILVKIINPKFIVGFLTGYISSIPTIVLFLGLSLIELAVHPPNEE